MQTSDRPVVVVQEQPQNYTELWLKQDTQTEFKTSLCDWETWIFVVSIFLFRIQQTLTLKAVELLLFKQQVFFLCVPKIYKIFLPCTKSLRAVDTMMKAGRIKALFVLTMRSGGGVLRMKHLICPFSPWRACWVCVLEMVGGPDERGKKMSHRNNIRNH